MIFRTLVQDKSHSYIGGYKNESKPVFMFFLVYFRI